MKNKYIIGALLIGIISLFASCSDDNDSNPTLIQPKEFTLNTPEYANATIDLEHSTGLGLTWHRHWYPGKSGLQAWHYLGEECYPPAPESDRCPKHDKV